MCGIIDFMKKKINGDLIISFCFCLLIILSGVMIKVNDKNKEFEVIANVDENITTTEEVTTTTTRKVVWDDLTVEELTLKLNKNLYSDLEGMGEHFARYTEETGLDPYLAVAIVNLETGCKWGCSTLARSCNNIGGIKGSPSCNGGSYKRFDTLEEGIKSYLDLVYYNYYSVGLDTAEKMNPKYAESTSWAFKVNNYYNDIKNTIIEDS